MKQRGFFNYIWNHYPDFQNGIIKGRYLTFGHIESELEKIRPFFKVKEIGKSECDAPIHAVRLGTGPVKIFGWSQMHGNESTTTKALFDLFNLFRRYGRIPEVSEILKNTTLLFIPMLNPDGAEKYTRENYNSVDLNRDADKLTQKESRVLRECFENFGPDFCFNLHDQRTIFSAGNFGKPATVSFLAPAMDEERNVDESRKKAMKTIVAMNTVLQDIIPGQIGRYDDAFNINCSGDRFQSFGVPTILFEAGHYPGDYFREETRKYMALAILAGISGISSGSMEKEKVELYFSIPENHKDYCDILLKDTLYNGKPVDVAIQYRENIRKGSIAFEPVVQLIRNELPLLGHKEIFCNGSRVLNLNGDLLSENDIAEGILLNRDNISFKIE